MATKKYIGYGKKHPEFDSVTVTLNMDLANELAVTTERGKRLKFIVSARQEIGQYGETHSVFILQTDDIAAEEAAGAPAQATAPEPVQEPAAVSEPPADAEKSVKNRKRSKKG